MKRIVLVWVLSVSVLVTNAQELFDAISISDLPISGTARSMSMSGAFGALGGEPTSLITNPAGLGIYRSCEATISMHDTYSQHYTPSHFMGKNRFTLNQASYVHATLKNKNVLIASNFAISYNRLKNFQNRYQINSSPVLSLVGSMADQANGIVENSLIESANPFSNPRVGWLSALGYGSRLIKPFGMKKYLSLNDALVSSGYNCAESGSIDEFNVSYAANLAHWVYLGVSIGLQSLEKMVSSYYEEDFFSMSQESFSLKNHIVISGFGWNVKMGAIVRPISFLRLGFAYHTPTFYSLSQYNTVSMEARNVTNQKNELVKSTSLSAENYDKYQLLTPSQYLFSAAFILKKKGLIGIDYKLTDYRSLNYSENYSTVNFALQNRDVKKNAQLNHFLKLGVEYRVLNFMSLRIGGAFSTPTVTTDATKVLSKNTVRTDAEYIRGSWSYYASGGIGFRWTYWGVDIAYQYCQQYATFTPFTGAKTMNLTNKFHNILLTGSFRF